MVGSPGLDKGGCLAGRAADGELVGFAVGEGKTCELSSCFAEVEPFWNGRGNIGELRKAVLRFEMVGDQFDREVRFFESAKAGFHGGAIALGG